MEKVTDFIKEMKLRLASPFFSSFLITWIIINWKVPIGLFFYDQKELEADGYKSYFDLITESYTDWYFVWYPVFCALGYSFLFPLLRNAIQVVNTLINSKGTDLSIWAAKGSKVPIEKYLELKGIYEARSKILENVLEKETEYLKDYESTRTEVLELRNKQNELVNERNKYLAGFDVAKLAGDWIGTYEEEGTTKKKIVSIRNNQMVFRNQDKSESTKIESFFYDHEKELITFCTITNNSEIAVANYYALRSEENMAILRGKINETVDVTFERQNPFS